MAVTGPPSPVAAPARSMTQISELLARIDRAHVVSFDIFDTVVRRPFLRSDDALLFLERKHGATGWFKARKQGESLALKALGVASVTLDEIYAHTPGPHAAMKEIEIAFDLDILRPIAPIVQAIGHAQAKGKTVVFTSDTYYPATVLAQILARAGVKGPFEILASSEQRETKSNGKLFDVLLDRFKQVDRQLFLHIGDNAHSDLRSAQTRHIPAHKLTSAPEALLGDHRFAWMRRYGEVQASPRDLPKRLLRSYQLGVLANALQDGYFEGLDPFSRIFLYALPFILNFQNDFTHQAAERIAYRDIAFIARDGYLLKHLFDDSYGDRGYRTRYVYAPRLLARKISLDFESISAADIRTLIRLHVQADAGLATHFAGIDFTADNHARILALFNTHRAAFDASAARFEQAYGRYLQSIGQYQTDLICVDWGGVRFSAQRLLARLSRQVQGVYCNCKTDSTLPMHSYIQPLLPFYELIEMYISSPEGPIVDLAESSTGFTPVYKDLPQEASKRERVDQHLALTRRFVADFSFDTITHADFAAEGFTEIYAHALTAMSDDEMRQLGEIRNCESLSHDADDFVDVWPRLQKKARKSLSWRRWFRQWRRSS